MLLLSKIETKRINKPDGSTIKETSTAVARDAREDAQIFLVKELSTNDSNDAVPENNAWAYLSTSMQVEQREWTGYVLASYPYLLLGYSFKNSKPRLLLESNKLVPLLMKALTVVHT